MSSNHKQWLVPFALQLIPAGLLIIGAVFIKESPRWLLSRDKREKAITNLMWIRQLEADDIYIVEEIGAIDQALEDQRSAIGAGFWSPFIAAYSNKRVMYRLFLGSMLFFWQNGSGINAINYYSPTVFKSIGIQGTNTALFTTGLFGVVKTAGTFIWILYLIDHLGRRLLLMIGAFGGSICMWIIGVYIKIAEPANHPTSQLGSGGIAAVFFFYLWTAFYTPSWNGTPWVMNSVSFVAHHKYTRISLLLTVLQEMFDPNMRSLAQAVAAASNWLWNFLISRFTPQMFATMDYGVYFFFSSLMILSIAFVYFLIPETKGIPLESMDLLFEQNSIPNAHKTVLAQIREDEERFRRDLEASGIAAEKRREIEG